MAHGPRKQPQDFGDNLRNVTLRLGSWLGAALPWQKYELY